MIIQWFVDLLVGLFEWLMQQVWDTLIWVLEFLQSPLGWLMGQLPTIELPDWAVPIPGMIATITGYMAKMDYWVPVTLIAPVLGFVVASYVIALGIRIARMVASIASGGGGA